VGAVDPRCGAATAWGGGGTERRTRRGGGGAGSLPAGGRVLAAREVVPEGARAPATPSGV
jgi:hypothetical protein